MRLASIGRTTSLAFAFVLAPILAAALALTVVLTLTGVFRKGLFLVVRHGLERDPRTVGCARGIGSRSERSAQEAGHSRTGKYCLRMFHTFLWLRLISFGRRGYIKRGRRFWNVALRSYPRRYMGKRHKRYFYSHRGQLLVSAGK
jgi:hypothetical protein